MTRWTMQCMPTSEWITWNVERLHQMGAQNGTQGVMGAGGEEWRAPVHPGETVTICGRVKEFERQRQLAVDKYGSTWPHSVP